MLNNNQYCTFMTSFNCISTWWMCDDQSCVVATLFVHTADTWGLNLEEVMITYG